MRKSKLYLSVLASAAMVISSSVAVLGAETDTLTEQDTAVEAPAEEAVEAPAEEAVEVPAEEAIEAPTEEAVEAPAEEAVEAPAEEAVEAPAEEAVEAPAEEAVNEPSVGTAADDTENDDTTEEPEEVKNGWHKNEQGLWQYYENGSLYSEGIYVIDDVPYGFKEGVMVTGWYTDGENKYYFEPNGAMRVGWLWDGAWYYLNEVYDYGACVTDTMRDIFGTVYAFDKNGKMITGWYSDTYEYEQEDGTTETFTDWYYFNSDGSMNRDGWLYWKGGWYYLDKYSGVMAKDSSRYIDGVSYFFDENGKMYEGGWYFDSYVDEFNNERGSWYYLNADGSYKTGWIWDNGWYYLQNNGVMVGNGVYTIDGEDYLFNASGLMISGWYQTYYYNDEGKKEYSTWYYGKSDGTVYKGWLKWGNAWYYLSEYTGSMYDDGLCYVDESQEYFAFDKSGKMITGWYYDEYIWIDEDGMEHDDGEWYFMDSNGYAQHGWLKWNNKWYYLNEYNGAMYEDVINIMVDGKYYSFDEKGAMLTGWVFESYGFTDEDGKEYGTWYYFGPSGDKQYGWILDGKTWYYLDRASGTMYDTGMYFIDGKYYAFDESGAMLTGWIEDEYENVYYFDTNGAGYTGFIDKDGNKGYKEGKDMYYCDHGWKVTNGSYYIKGEGKYGLFDEDGYFIDFAPEPTEPIAEKAVA